MALTGGVTLVSSGGGARRTDAAVLAAGSSGGGRHRRLGVAYELRSGGGETLLHGEESEMVRAPRNRLAPRYINIAITRYNDVGATEKGKVK